MTWPTVELGEITRKIGSGATPRGGNNAYKKEGIPLVRSMNVHDGHFKPAGLAFIDEEQASLLSNVELQKHDVLLNITGASVARCCRLPEKYTGGRVNQHVSIIRPKLEKVLPEYLEHLLVAPETKARLLGIASGGATREAITKTAITEFKIPLPPLEEQRRIAGILDQADALRRLRTRALDKLNTLGQAIFHEMFGDQTQSNTKVALGDVCDVRDGTHDSPKYVEDGFPLLTSKNFSSGKLSMVGAKKISEDDYVKINKRSKVDIGDIVMPMIGTIGSPVIIEEPPSFAIKNVALIKFQETSPKASFVHALLSSDYLDRIVKKQGRGGTQKFVSLGDLRKLEFQLPSAAKQSEFEIRAKKISAHCYAHETALAVTKALFTSIQHRAFRGEL